MTRFFAIPLVTLLACGHSPAQVEACAGMSQATANAACAQYIQSFCAEHPEDPDLCGGGGGCRGH